MAPTGSAASSGRSWWSGSPCWPSWASPPSRRRRRCWRRSIRCYAVEFFRHNGWHGFGVLGAVFLAVTGAEALYADMGHFGKRPIRIAWFVFVLPALLLNYFGQGSLVLRNPSAAEQPFFLLAPEWMRLPLVALATMAAIIASQALISGAFSLTRAAIQLGYAPRLDVEHTSRHEMGQVYVPQVNWFLALSTIIIVIGFRSSSGAGGGLRHRRGVDDGHHRAAAAGGGDRAMEVADRPRRDWWPRCSSPSICRSSVATSSRSPREDGCRWSSASLIFTLMTTWKTGRRLVAERLTARAHAARGIHEPGSGARRRCACRGTAVFMTAQPRGHAAGPAAQRPLQQGAARARDRADRVHGAGAARVARGSAHDRTLGRRRLRRPRPLRLHGRSDRARRTGRSASPRARTSISRT